MIAAALGALHVVSLCSGLFFGSALKVDGYFQVLGFHDAFGKKVYPDSSIIPYCPVAFFSIEAPQERRIEELSSSLSLIGDTPGDREVESFF